MTKLPALAVAMALVSALFGAIPMTHTGSIAKNVHKSMGPKLKDPFAHVKSLRLMGNTPAAILYQPRSPHATLGDLQKMWGRSRAIAWRLPPSAHVVLMDYMGPVILTVVTPQGQRERIYVATQLVRSTHGGVHLRYFSPIVVVQSGRHRVFVKNPLLYRWLTHKGWVSQFRMMASGSH